jgi:MoaA/NifB/PqqE/SkfB family radical SAM enzyme
MVKKILKKGLVKIIKHKKSISKKEFLLALKLLKYLPVPYTLRKKLGQAKWEINEIKKAIENEEPLAFSYPNRILSEIHPNCKEKIIENFLFGIIKKYNENWKKTESEGSFSPATVLISPTMRCNLSCVGCYAKNYKKEDDLPNELFEKIIREGEKLGVFFYTILGGEPLMVFDKIYKIFKKYNSTYAQVFTNGTLLTDKIAQKLQELGNIFVNFSIEGFEKETDERRGKGVFKKVIFAMELLKKYGIPHGFSVVYSRKNAEVVISDEFIDLMIDKGCLWGWYFLYMPVCGDKDLSLMATPEQRYNLWKRHLEIRQKKPIVVIDFWGDAPIVGGCIAGKYYIHINNYGFVEPCIFTHFSKYNIKEKGLKEIMASGVFKEYRKRQPFSKNLLLPCPLIDHPYIFREIQKKFDLKPTHPGAETLIGELSCQLDDYSKKVHQIFEKVWQENYQSKFSS